VLRSPRRFGVETNPRRFGVETNPGGIEPPPPPGTYRNPLIELRKTWAVDIFIVETEFTVMSAPPGDVGA
jgi:hypothetical protein